MTIIATNSTGIPKFIRTDDSGNIQAVLIDGATTSSITADNRLRVRNSVSQFCFYNDYAGAQTNAVVITPASGKKILIKNAYASTSSVDVDIVLKFTTSGNIFFKVYTSKTQTSSSAELCALGDANETVSLTCGAGTFVSIAYEEV